MDIKLPDLKAIFEKLSVLRNYMNLVVPLIIAVVAGMMFIPTALLSGGLKQKIKTESLARGSTLERMAAAPISKDQYKVERKYQQAYADDANRIERMAKEGTERELLSTKIFPLPKDTSVLIFEEFGKRFRAGIEERITQLRGRDIPTQAELAEHLRSVQGQSTMADPRAVAGMMNTTGRRGAGRLPMPGTAGEYGDYGMGNPLVDQIIEAVCQERAQSAGLYVNPMDVAGYKFWTQYRYDAGTEQAVTDCWYWQLGYWIIEDVFDTITSCNIRSKNVLESPVKRLMRVGFSRAMMTDQGPYAEAMPQDGTQTDARPQYVLAAYSGLTWPCTGRITKGDIQIVHFEVTVVVRAGAVMDFLKHLCSAKEHRFSGFDGQQPPRISRHNQITVLECTMRAVDRSNTGTTGMGMYAYGDMGMETGMGMGTTSHQLCRYGQDAVVELDLICEYLLEKAGYESIIPDAVKKAVEIAAAAMTPMTM